MNRAIMVIEATRGGLLASETTLLIFGAIHSFRNLLRDSRSISKLILLFALPGQPARHILISIAALRTLRNLFDSDYNAYRLFWSAPAIADVRL